MIFLWSFYDIYGGEMKATPLRQAGDDKNMKTKRIHGEINQNDNNRKAKQENTVFYSLGLFFNVL